MPSAVNVGTFPNKKPKLIGSLSTSTTGPTGPTSGNIGLSGLQSGDTNVGGFSFTPTSEFNVAFLRCSVYVTNNAFIKIFEGAVELASAGGGGTGTRTTSFIVENTSIGLHNYTYTIVRNGSDYQFTSAGHGVVATGAGVDIIDTHDTKNTRLISG